MAQPTITPITFPPQGETTLIAFYQRMAAEVGELGCDILNHLARSLIERGWLPTVSSTVEQLTDMADEAKVRAALDDLQARRLLTLSDDGARIAGLLGTLSVGRTRHRAHLSTGVDVFTFGGMDLLSVEPMLTKAVDAFTQCGQCDRELTLKIAGETIQDTEPAELAGFQASWDGQSPLSDVSEASPLFCSDACLEQWQAGHPEVEGLPLSADLLLFVGMSMATESGHARYELIKMG